MRSFGGLSRQMRACKPKKKKKILSSNIDICCEPPNAVFNGYRGKDADVMFSL